MGLALAACLCSAPPAAAIEVSGTPTCGPSGSIFVCGIQFSSVTGMLSAGQPFEVDITLENAQQIALFDTDVNNDSFAIAIALDNTGNQNLVNVQFDLAFTDLTGAILDPPGEQSPFVFINVQPDTKLAGFTSLGVELSALLPVVFHDVHLTLTASDDIQLDDLDQITFAAIDDTSNVVPEPGTSALLGAGLLALALSSRGLPRRAVR